MTMARLLSLGWALVCCLTPALPEFAARAAEEVPAFHFGMRAVDADSPIARRLNIRTERGALVTRVTPDAPAAKAGLRPGDVVVKFGEARIARYADLEAAVRRASLGHTYRFEFYRGSKYLFANVTAERRPPPPGGGYPQTFNLGLRGVSAGSALARRFGIESPLGMVVTEVRPGGAAAAAGLRPGDLIVRFAGRSTDTFEDYQAAAFTCPLGSRQPVSFVRGSTRADTTITIASGTRFDLPAYYRHGQGGYRFPLLPEWYSFSIEQPGIATELQYDRIISIFAGYELRCYKGSWPANSETAVQDFIAAEQRGNPRRHAGRGTLAGVPAAWVTMPAGGEPYLVYRIGLFRQGRRYLIDALAPVLSDPEHVPLPVSMHLDKLEFLQREGLAGPAPTVPEPTAGSPGGVPPAGDEPGAWYRHPRDIFRIPVPRGWTVMGGYRGTERDDAFDTIVDPEGRHRIICWRDSEPAPNALPALEKYTEEKRRELGQREGISAAGFSINGIPVMRMTYPISDGRVVSRTAAVSRGRRVPINTVSPAGTAPDRLPALLENLLAKTQFPDSKLALPDTRASAPGEAPATPPETAETPKVPPGWVTSQVGNVTLSVPPEWTAEQATPEGHGMWRLGEGELPKASLALVRNQPWDRFSPQVEAPEHRKTTVAGRKADVYEGTLVDSQPPAKLRVVVFAPERPLDDTLTWVCYARADTWVQFTAILDTIFATLSVKPNP